MVLQRDQNVNLWGTATPSDDVKLTFRGDNYVTTADQNGAWSIALKPTPSGGPYDITVTSSISGEGKLFFHNLIFFIKLFLFKFFLQFLFQ